MLRSFLSCLCILPGLLAAQVHLPATTEADLHDLEALARQHPTPAKLVQATEGRYPTALVHGRCSVGFLAQVDGSFHAADAPEGVVFGARIGAVQSLRVDMEHIAAIRSIPSLVYAELAGKVRPDLDLLLKSARVDSVHMGYNLPQAYSGEGVLIGVTDWGFDYTHPMFYDTALTTTRIRAAWDQYRQAGPAPDGYSYGTLLSTPVELAAAASDTVNIYGNATHGSHVAGIAGGSGAGTPYRGVAYGAQFLFATFLVDAAAVLDAFAWMRQVAEADQKRLVINMSWGLHHMGTLDGTSLLSQAIDQHSAEGVVFANSGGNNGDVDFHIKHEFTGDTLRSRVQFYPYSAHPKMWGQSLTLWGEPGESFSAGFRVMGQQGTEVVPLPWYHTATQPAYLDSMVVLGNDTVFFNLATEAAHPLNGRPHMRLRLKNKASQYWLELKATAAEGIVHAWNVTELTNDVGNWGQAFQTAGSGTVAGDHHYGISEPACTESLITVAAYRSEYFTLSGFPLGGQLADFSSFGPTLDDRRKPDIAAPGVGVASSISSYTDNSYTPLGAGVVFNGRTYPFARFSGTSMASPAVAGVAALLLQADPDLQPQDVKDILMATTRTDDQTGIIPPEGSLRWGMGKMNAYWAMISALGVTGVEEPTSDGLLVWPNPAREEFHIALGTLTGADQRFVVRDVAGRTVHAGRLTGPLTRVGTADWPAGVYVVQLEGTNGRMQARLAHW